MYTVYWYIGIFLANIRLFEVDSFSCGWRQAKFIIKEEFDVRCGGPSRAYLPKQNHYSLLILVFMYIMFDELLKETGRIVVYNNLKYRIVIDYVTA